MSYWPHVSEITCRNRPQTRLKRGWENTVNKAYLKETMREKLDWIFFAQHTVQ
jgi:hypothetical protein